MIDKKFYQALPSLFLCVLSVVICACALLAKVSSAEIEVTATPENDMPGPTPAVEQAALPTEDISSDAWVTYLNDDVNYRLCRPPTWSVEEAPDHSKITIGDQIIIAYRENDRYWVNCSGDCPIVEGDIAAELSGSKARKLSGYIGSVGGYIPQEYITYILEYRGGYLIFTLYALGLEVEYRPTDSVWSLNPEDVQTFERMMASLRVDVEPGTLAESAASCREFSDDQPNTIIEPEIPEGEAAGMSPVEIVELSFGRYLAQYQGPGAPPSSELIDYQIELVEKAPALADFALEMGVDAMYWVTYSVQPVDVPFWMVGNGVLGENGWVFHKMMIVGLTKIGEVYKLTIHGTGP